MAVNPVKDDLWLRCYNPAPSSEVRLVCFPHAGGSAPFYFPMAKALPSSVEMLAVQYPGRQDRRTEPLIDDINRLADTLFDVLRHLTDRPLALFGHSMGAVVAFEIAQRLENVADTVPVALFASGRRAPSCDRDEHVHTLDDHGLIADLKALNGTNSALLGSDDLLELILPAVRNDYRAVETYRWRPGPKLNCPISVFTGDEDSRVTADEARAWERHTTGEFALRTFHGGHFFLADHQEDINAAVLDRILPPLR
ncbi:thioesterase [Streptomyces ipomoeae]|uniref:Thioesterase n=1 Tax=Streptomyces ipomoeae TaxID=103232 RepID=A0AAE9AZ52_9ACTN|nr:alpha/beta fold hydrolase [Streptomyces ipomoeae]MDX2695319.1 alpha/beta fold hydrolase [Streptomyces ipomoeae]MDX2823198.1 alpha/beta fold hydrolase [Streptomyces ipomoeae]MDX2841333.1 alpha/beta fold hydrolase [Streptomyces ipomoeae]MDX2875803.1 alpha/beta fold hydrolase [Streptomyces ipomoeae]TQE22726.1 thioesterase [Streptomyces ipomoeae]